MPVAAGGVVFDFVDSSMVEAYATAVDAGTGRVIPDG